MSHICTIHIRDTLFKHFIYRNANGAVFSPNASAVARNSLLYGDATFSVHWKQRYWDSTWVWLFNSSASSMSGHTLIRKRLIWHLIFWGFFFYLIFFWASAIIHQCPKPSTPARSAIWGGYLGLCHLFCQAATAIDKAVNQTITEVPKNLEG